MLEGRVTRGIPFSKIMGAGEPKSKTTARISGTGTSRPSLTSKYSS